MSKQFKVIAVSENTNSFGLHQMILVAQDGETWKVASNAIRVKEKGDVIILDKSWSHLGFEIPEQIDDAPNQIIKSVWPSC